ncbi:MAG: ADP-ribosylglycohydrolase family protein [Desulfobacterales bacterium]|nr:ADP-ribosylglycohydrolase family protein [Desulfobacterales bacterium]
MKENAKAAVLASFAADSLALGAHWIYDTAEIDEKIGRVDRLLAPPEGGFHAGKKAGDFTHYGDQTLVLLESLAEAGGFDLDAFARGWRDFFAGYKGYFDHATTETLEGFSAGKGPDKAGSTSTDLGGAARIAPIVFACAGDLDAMVAAARQQTAMTHRAEPVVRAAEFLARVVHRVLSGSAPDKAVAEVREEGFSKGDFGMWVEEGLASAGRGTRSAVAGFGQHCGVMAALPSVIHLVARYPDDLEAALVENVMAGGDSAARGMAAAMILGAHGGPGAIPDAWLSGLSALDRIVELLQRIGGD